MRNVLLQQLTSTSLRDGWTKAELEEHAKTLRLGQPGALAAIVLLLTETDRREIELFSTLSERDEPPNLDKKTLAKALRALANLYDP